MGSTCGFQFNWVCTAGLGGKVRTALHLLLHSVLLLPTVCAQVKHNWIMKNITKNHKNSNVKNFQSCGAVLPVVQDYMWPMGSGLDTYPWGGHITVNSCVTLSVSVFSQFSVYFSMCRLIIFVSLSQYHRKLQCALSGPAYTFFSRHQYYIFN